MRRFLYAPFHALMHLCGLNYVVLAIKPDGYYMCCVHCWRQTFYASFEELDRIIYADMTHDDM